MTGFYHEQAKDLKTKRAQAASWGGVMIDDKSLRIDYAPSVEYTLETWRSTRLPAAGRRALVETGPSMASVLDAQVHKGTISYVARSKSKLSRRIDEKGD